MHDSIQQLIENGNKNKQSSSYNTVNINSNQHDDVIHSNMRNNGDFSITRHMYRYCKLLPMIILPVCQLDIAVATPPRPLYDNIVDHPEHILCPQIRQQLLTLTWSGQMLSLLLRWNGKW